MNIPSEQKQQVLSNFHLLCNNFLPSKEIREKIRVVFQEQEVEGRTFFKFSDKSFIISFWNQEYKSRDFLLKVVAHEFTHVIFFLNQGQHKHNWIFFIYVEVFYYWLKTEAKN